MSRATCCPRGLVCVGVVYSMVGQHMCLCCVTNIIVYSKHFMVRYISLKLHKDWNLLMIEIFSTS